MIHREKLLKPFHEGSEKKGGLNNPPKNPRPLITPPGQCPHPNKKSIVVIITV